jgi:hypothetical protein
MELVSMAAGTPWSDHPPSTHPLLAHAARRVNDALSPESRQRLLPLVAPLARANSTDPGDVPRLALACTTVAMAWRPNPLLHRLNAAAEWHARSAHAPSPRGTAMSRVLYGHGTAYRSIDIAAYALLAGAPHACDQALTEMLVCAIRVFVPQWTFAYSEMSGWREQTADAVVSPKAVLASP